MLIVLNAQAGTDPNTTPEATPDTGVPIILIIVGAFCIAAFVCKKILRL